MRIRTNPTVRSLLLMLFIVTGQADDLSTLRRQLWEEYRETLPAGFLPAPTSAEPGGPDLRLQLQQIGQPLEVGGKSMPYVFLRKGERPAGGWPLFIQLHGGGANPQAPGPHAWWVNTREWQAQVGLFQQVYPITGLAFIPRMPDDRDGRWYYGYIQEAVDKVIQDAIAHHDVNPDKIFLTGISEGGYAGFRLASLMADRFAGSCAMAAAEPIPNAPPENLRNLAFRCGIGERDTQFNRIGLARDYFARLEDLQREDPTGYRFMLDVQEGRGHGIDYREGPAWISQFERTAMPRQINWTVIRQHDRSRNRMYWLALDGDPGELPLRIRAAVQEDNRVSVKADRKQGEEWVPATGLSLEIYLPDIWLDLSRPVTIDVNGKPLPSHRFEPDRDVGLQSLHERGDPKALYLDQVQIRL